MSRSAKTPNMTSPTAVDGASPRAKLRGMSKQVIALTTPEAARAEITRREEELERLERARVETELRLAEARAALEVIEAEAEETGPRLRDQIMTFAAVRGEITISALRHLFPEDQPHHLHLALQQLVEDGRLVRTDERGIPVNGRGAAPHIYRVVPNPPEGVSRRRRTTGRTPTQK